MVKRDRDREGEIEKRERERGKQKERDREKEREGERLRERVCVCRYQGPNGSSGFEGESSFQEINYAKLIYCKLSYRFT